MESYRIRLNSSNFQLKLPAGAELGNKVYVVILLSLSCVFIFGKKTGNTDKNKLRNSYNTIHSKALLYKKYDNKGLFKYLLMLFEAISAPPPCHT